MIVEIRTYRLVPGTSEEFVRVMRDEAWPLLDATGIRVVASGLSQVREDGLEEAYLVRAFDSIEHRDAQEEAFYGSRAWHDGPREAILSRIESYHTVVLDAAELGLPATR
jgi:hypothetical protein